MRIAIEYKINEKEAEVVTEGIRAFNSPFFGGKRSPNFAVFLKDESDQVLGGVLAWMRPGIHLLFIDILWVAESHREKGFGTKLLLAAEEEGKKQGCTHVQMETLPFQAEEFYKKRGYHRIGFVEKLYGPHDAIFLRKLLV